jgi:UDP-N-acetylglucosamine 2-epimerase (non-hydrolysing)/GDP/UDP-N,N'-diacetylbacillosamine 2-epimerase (hydrolysing)
MTGTRADYGHLYWVLRELDADPRTDLQLVVTGAHLMERFGATVRQIEDDGYAIAARVPMDLSDDTPRSVAGALAAATSGLADAFARLQPDLVVLLGDRYEELAAAQAALILGIPVAHLHGGETTEGAFDEAIRHSVTKMSHLHFVAAEEYGRRVRQLGEDPARVHVVGAPGLDHLHRTELARRNELEGFLGIALTAPVLLVTYHPETLGDDGGRSGLGRGLQPCELEGPGSWPLVGRVGSRRDLGEERPLVGGDPPLGDPAAERDAEGDEEAESHERTGAEFPPWRGDG